MESKKFVYEFFGHLKKKTPKNVLHVSDNGMSTVSPSFTAPNDEEQTQKSELSFGIC